MNSRENGVSGGACGTDPEPSAASTLVANRTSQPTRAESTIGGARSLAQAVAIILAGSALGLAGAAFAAPAERRAVSESDARGLRQIIVTAQRRTENLQDVPITIQAFTDRTLAELNVKTFDDLVAHLPNVTSPGNGPGQSYIYMRGLSSGGSAGTQSSGSTGGFPNVAIYLDDQSAQLPGRNLDVYAADLERIEVLEGPQGTLFGAGAEAGVIRYITNKPVLDRTEGNVTAGYGVTAHGDPNSNLSAVLNLPLIDHKMALRAVIYDDSRGGYIDNVPATFTRRNSDIGIHYANYPAVNGQCPDGRPHASYCVPPNSPVINNYNIAQRAINPASYKGGRAELLYKLNDDWDILVTQMYQNLDTQGVFYQQPNASDGQPLAPLEVTLFNPSYDKDRFENTAWTIEGRIGAIKAIYTGSYLDRHVDQVGDYTNYARGVYADYYQCHGAEANHGLTAVCYSPSSTWRERERNTHQSDEIRLSTPNDWRTRAILGAFYEDFSIQDQTQWYFKTLPACTSTVTAGCLTDVAPVPGATTAGAPPPNDSTAFFEDIQRGYRQYAFFGSVDFDLMPKILTATAGTRYYHFDNRETGMSVSGFGCYEAGPAPCASEGATNMDAEHLRSSYSGFTSRANITWHIGSDALLYYTWSQGFRPGGFNQASSCHALGTAYNNFCTPLRYTSDRLTNNELGWKTQFLDHRVQWDGAVYQENWNNVQVDFFDPGQLGNLLFFTNGPNYRIHGLETTLSVRVAGGLIGYAGASWNRSQQTNSPFLIANDPSLLQNPTAAADFGKPITAFQNPYGPVGSPSANSPPMQFNVRLRYEFSIDGGRAFVQASAMHTGHSFTQAGSNPSLAAAGAINTTFLRFEDPAYSLFDASAGIDTGAWHAEVYASNLTNKIVSVFTSTGQFIEAQAVIRPRVIGIDLGFRF